MNPTSTIDPRPSSKSSETDSKLNDSVTQINDASPPEKEKATAETDDNLQQEEYPDGGTKAWLVAAGASCSLFCTMGFVNVFGVFQAYYMYNQLKDESPDKISWIGSIQAFLVFASGIIGGPLFDRYGAWIIRPAAVLYVFSIMMTSLCTQYWHFMLAQGVLSGISNGLVMFPAMSAVPQWFHKKRGAAMGAAIAGSSIGALVFPLMLSKLLNATDLGFGWSMRIAGFVMLPPLAIACLTVRGRLPPRKTRFLLLEAFQKPMYDLLIVSMFFTMVGMFVPLFLIPTYAITQGMAPTLASYLVAIVNGVSFLGRVIPGVLGDKFGRLNIYVLAGIFTAILCFCWPLAKSNASIIVFASFFGFFSGAIVSGGTVAITLCVDDPREIGTYMGMGMALASFAALAGPPASGALFDAYEGFYEVSYFSGGMTLFGALLAILAKWKSSAGLLGIS